MSFRANAHPFEQDQAEASEIRLTKRAATSDIAPSPYRVARDLVAQGQHYRALRTLESALSQGYETPEALRLFARAARHLGEHALAQRALARAVELDPEDVVTSINYVRMLLRNGETHDSGRRLGAEIVVGLQTANAMAAQDASVLPFTPTTAGPDVVCGACSTAQTRGKFCRECGDALAAPKRFCHACGGDLVATAKFCTECGTSAPPVTNSGHTRSGR